MSLFGVAPRKDAPAHSQENLRQESEMNARIARALDDHKKATDDIVKSSLNQVQRAEDVKLVINSLSRRLAYQDATLRTAQGVLDLVSTRERGQR